MRTLAKLIPLLTMVMMVTAGGAGCTAKMKAAYHQERADRYYDSGQFDRAEIEYKNVLRNSPQNARAWSHLGFIYFDQGRMGEAAQVLRRASQLATNDLTVRLKLGTICLEAGQNQEAWNVANSVLDKTAGESQAPILLAESAGTNRLEETRQRLQKLLPAGGSAPFDVAFGVLAIRQGDFKTAAADFLHAETIDPKCYDACAALGNLYAAQKDWKRADQEFKKATEMAPPRSGKTLQYAQFKILTGDSAAGKLLLEDVLKKAPDYLPAWIALARIAASEKKYPEGVTLLGNVLSRDPQNVEAGLLKSRLELLEGDAGRSLSDLGAMAKNFPKIPLVFFQLAQAHLAANETGKAITDLNQALLLNPGYEEAILSLAEIQIQTGDLVAAIEALQGLTRKSPQIVPAWLLLADAYEARGLAARAVQIYRDLIKTDPKNPEFHLLLGTAWLRQTNLPEARLEFDQTLALAPDYLPALEKLVTLDLMERKYATAEKRVSQEISRNPQAASLQLLRANIQLAEGDTNGAEGTLTGALALQPDFEAACLTLAQLHAARRQNEQALADLRTFLSKNPEASRVLLFLGITCDHEKKYQEASDAYEMFLAKNPDNVPVMNNLACIWADHLGKLDQGYRLALRARELVPTDPSIADTLGWILYQKEQFSSAVSLLKEAAARRPGVPEIQFHLALACYKLGDEPGATAAFQAALRPGVDFPEKADCEQYLTVLALDPATAGSGQRAWLEKWVARQPGDSIALLRLAAVCEREGAMDRAITSYEAVLQSDPRQIQAMVNLARILTSRDLEKAFGLAKEAYKLAPNDPGVVHTLGRLALQTGDYPWALSLLQITDQIQPQNPEVRYDMAEALYDVGQVTKAIIAMQTALQSGTGLARASEGKDFLAMANFAVRPSQDRVIQTQVDAILKSAPDYIPALIARAVIAEEKSDLAGAEQVYESLLAKHPHLVPAQKRLATLYARESKNDDQAYALAEQANRFLPDDPELIRTLGILACRKGDYGRAEGFLRESAAQNTEDAELMFYWGTIQYHFKNSAGSEASLQRALDLKLSPARALEARRLLSELQKTGKSGRPNLQPAPTEESRNDR